MTKTLVILLTTFGSIGTASAMVDLYHLDDAEFLTQFSGYRNAVVRKGGEEDYKALYGLELAEEGDGPCYLKAKSRHLNNYSTASYTYDANGCSENDSSRETVEFTGTDTYIRGIQVCMNSDGERIKGVKIFGATLNRSTGALTNVATPKEFDRPNCNTWKVAQYCPPGEVATQVRISYVDFAYYTDEINGLALVCRAVEPV
jgi:hypothetical protein